MGISRRCRQGAVFSYSTGEYSEADNSFLVFNYNNWGIAVMEDEGTYADHYAGFGSTDGQWHHIAVTWESASGTTRLYDNGRVMWASSPTGRCLPFWLLGVKTGKDLSSRSHALSCRAWESTSARVLQVPLALPGR